MCYVFTGSNYDPHLQFGLSQYCFQLTPCLAGFTVVSNLCFDKIARFSAFRRKCSKPSLVVLNVINWEPLNEFEKLRYRFPRRVIDDLQTFVASSVI